MALNSNLCQKLEMISKQSLDPEWIKAIAAKNKKADPGLVEKLLPYRHYINRKSHPVRKAPPPCQLDCPNSLPSAILTKKSRIIVLVNILMPILRKLLDIMNGFFVQQLKSNFLLNQGTPGAS